MNNQRHSFWNTITPHLTLLAVFTGWRKARHPEETLGQSVRKSMSTLGKVYVTVILLVLGAIMVSAVYDWTVANPRQARYDKCVQANGGQMYNVTWYNHIDDGPCGPNPAQHDSAPWHGWLD